MQPNWRDLLDYVKNEGTREVSVQRYKGLGEMNAEQLVGDDDESRDAHAAAGAIWRTSPKREAIFSTLMGEDVESRRKFIEENALDVRNLDI